FRAHFALPDSITDAEGQPVNALLGTTNLILLELERRPARAVILCFGEEAATYRTELYAGYHADREDPPEPLARQFADAPDFFDLRGGPSDGLPGGRGIGEKTAADLLARHGSLEGALAAWAGETPRIRGALHDQADELRSFKDIATLRQLDLERPPDRSTDYRGGAAAARARGMFRLAERLEKMAEGATQ